MPSCGVVLDEEIFLRFAMVVGGVVRTSLVQQAKNTNAATFYLVRSFEL